MDLYYYYKSCLILHEKSQNDYISMRGQVNPFTVQMYNNKLLEMEHTIKYYSDMRNKILEEIEKRIKNIKILADEEEN